MSRSLLVYTCSLVAALVGSYLTWIHEPPADATNAPVVADIDAQSVERVRYTAPDRKVVVTRRESDRGESYWWVESTKEGEMERFRANPAFEQFLADLEPLRAVRVLSPPDQERLSDFGFGSSTATLTIITGDQQERTFEIGSRTYGGRRVYLRDPRSGEYIVVDSNVVAPFDYAGRRLRKRESP